MILRSRTTPEFIVNITNGWGVCISNRKAEWYIQPGERAHIEYPVDLEYWDDITLDYYINQLTK